MGSAQDASSPCCNCETKLQDLNAQLSDLQEENANLRLLDQSMRRNNALFEALLANSAVGIALTGPDRRIVRVVRGLTGYSPGDLAGALIEDVAIPEDREAIVDCYKLLLNRSCQQVRREFRIRRADGSIRWFAATLTDMLDDPNVQAIVWNYLDVTAQKESPNESPIIWP